MRAMPRLTTAILLGVPAALIAAACGGVETAPDPIGPDAKNYCAIVGACQLEPSFGFGECINEIARSQITLAPYGGDLGAQARYDCVKAAGTNCGKAKQCIGRVQTTDPRCTDPNAGDPAGNLPRSFCDGNRITVCDEMGPESQTFTCGDDFALQHFGGTTCVKNAPAGALCGFGSCDATMGAAPHCEGDTLVYCTYGVEQHTACAALGGTCDASAGMCTGTCDSTQYECHGTELVKVCPDGGKLPLYDCAARTGWTCRAPTDTTTFGCVPRDKECQWGVYQASCDGTKVKFCDDGKISEYDCKDAGAKSCVTMMAGVNCAL